MIVEDDVMYRYAIRTSFHWEKEGYRICGEAINGKHALAMLNECRPQIVITDINMPEMNGIDLILALHQLHPEISIIVLSSYDDFHFVRQAMKFGAKDYLLKHDIDPSELSRVLKELRHEETLADHVSPLTSVHLKIKGADQPEVYRVIEYVKAHYHEPISLQQLADQLFLSPNYLCNIFKHRTGMTIFEFIKLYRIETAKVLLETTTFRVYEIAEQIGFNNSSYLCRVFKEVTGININAYKRLHPMTASGTFNT